MLSASSNSNLSPTGDYFSSIKSKLPAFEIKGIAAAETIIGIFGESKINALAIELGNRKPPASLLSHHLALAQNMALLIMSGNAEIVEGFLKQQGPRSCYILANLFYLFSDIECKLDISGLNFLQACLQYKAYPCAKYSLAYAKNKSKGALNSDPEKLKISL